MKKVLLPAILLIVCILSSCEVLQQAQQMYYLTKCEFRSNGVKDVAVAGISLSNITKPEQFSLLDAAKLLSAARSDNFPLTFQVNIETTNPNQQEAGMNRMDYIVLVDDTQMASGTTNQKVTIAPNNGKAEIPMGISINLKDVFKGQTTDALVKFAKNLAGLSNDDSRITVKVKPYIEAAGRTIAYPDYITLSKEFKSK